ncbi:Phage tail sheath C-terminal domain containing protein [uncultured Caudovirales phage]|uniref:Phage tail sheath C-terminal domain containing protein n=1 Tax=uncultured Caudovirales phage TaxID=2100421 RepID=A0A6J5LFP8_9CAUD|nr:Phage tail sheath C-terminal domain containing protein [uncultured Caudovirales phage]
MALVSPGLQLTVTDESQYVPGAVGTVPLVILATAQDKANPSGSLAADTTMSRAGKLLSYTSQRELITALGYPSFQQSSAGTPLHGDERNEYGLMAAYSALGQVNKIYAIRADINLEELVGTSVRPTGAVSDGTYWLDLADSKWGINEWDATNGVFNLKTPILVTSSADLTLSSGIYVPKSSVGKIGSYAIAFNTGSNALVFYKNSSNIWVRVGTDAWMASWPTIKSTVSNPTIAATTPAAQLLINGTPVTIGSTSVSKSLTDVANAINAATITGVTANVVNARLEIYADSTSKSDGSIADGKISIDNAAQTPLSTLGITIGTYANPELTYNTYAGVPSWHSFDAVPRPSGSIFMKLGATGSGSDLVIKKYSSSTTSFVTQGAQFFPTAAEALYGLDPSGGGNGITAGSVWVLYDSLADSTGGFKPYVRRVTGQTKFSGSALSANPFTPSDTITIGVTSIGTNAITSYTVTLSGTTPASFVSDILAANIPEVSVSVDSNNVITFTHIYGGDIYLSDSSDNLTGPVADAGFSSSTANTIKYSTNVLALTNWSALTYTFSTTQPYQAPADGTLWYYSDAATVDIMINEIGGWRGYKSAYYDGSKKDARGYDLSLTDPNGVIVSASMPDFQSDGVTALAYGDLWLDIGDLENFPAIYRWQSVSGSDTWVLIDNTDQVGQNGIVFADARWDTDGTTDIITGSLPSVSTLLSSDYIDQDAPDFRLYPRGMLLFNLRRSGYNVKKYVNNYFSSASFPNLPTVPGAASSLPAITSAWVTTSGLKDNGSPYMGRQAQRKMVTAAMQAALSANTDIREEQFQFNIITAPGYPELIDEMVALNNDRANTAFIIGDTPMRLAPNAVDIANWSNNTNGDGLATADPYLAVYYPCGKSSDLQGNEIVVPASHIALRTMIHNDNVAYQWFAPAGTRRGLVDNASSIGYIDAMTGEFNFNSIRTGLRDTLYENKINPITSLPGVGLVVWGQKTRNPTASALDRINVARLVNYIRTILASVGNGFLFEPNDTITRNQIKNIISSAINDLVAKRGIYDYLVVCDESNNTPVRIARNELYVDIAIEPMKTVEFIYIPIRLKNPGDIKAGV